MAEIVRMPKLSDTMIEGVVAEWHKKIGDKVAEGDLLADIETDKATMEFESFYDGILLHIGIEKGAGAPVNSILAIIGEKGEDISTLIEESAEEVAPAEKAAPAKEEAAPAKEEVVPAAAQASPVAVPTAETTAAPENSNGRIFASPLARIIAEEKGINLAQVKGSGENNRIVKKDVENYTPSTVSSSEASTATIPQYNPAPVGTESFTEVTHSQMRKAIARTLSASKFTAPHFYLKIEVDMDNAIAARKAINADGDVKVSFNDIIVKAVAAALRKNPKVNADWTENAIRYNNHIHIGVAVAVEDGLLVPVVKFTDTKGLVQIGAEIKVLAEKAKTKKLQPQDMEGGTFAISNLGMFGIEDFTSIINPPNGCILSVGQIKETPVIRDGQIVPGNVMKLSLSCDHRVVDGAIGSAFLQDLKKILENPVRMII